MTDIPQDFSTAIGHHQAGRIAEAEAIYRKILAEDPDNIATLNNLGAIVDPAEGEAMLRRAVALRPDYVQALVNLADCLVKLGRGAETVPCLQQAVLFENNRVDLYFRLGSVLQSLGRLDDAVVPYEHAIALKPDFIPALYNLATCHALANRYGPASKWYRWVLALDPTVEGANRNMVSILESDGRLAEAVIYRARSGRPQPLEIETSPTPKRSVLILTTMGAGNVPLDFLLPRATTTRIKWFVDHATDEQENTLPHFDVVFNGIGNADLLDASAARMARFCGRVPVLNPPKTIEQTRRDLLPTLLAGIPDVVAPPVVRLRRDQVIGGGVAEQLAAHGISCPVLVRPISTQGGGGLTLLETPEELAQFEYSDADAFYFIAYSDYRSADGFFRKYRMIFVDRVAYPYHLAISQHWLVHYFSANMLEAPWKRDEEIRFLDDPKSAIGARAVTAVSAIARRMNMDYAGIDFSVLADGRVVVFEANATMSVHLHDPVDLFPYKHVHVPKIINAFEAMVARRQKAMRLTNP